MANPLRGIGGILWVFTGLSLIAAIILISIGESNYGGIASVHDKFLETNCTVTNSRISNFKCAKSSGSIATFEVRKYLVSSMINLGFLQTTKC